MTTHTLTPYIPSSSARRWHHATKPIPSAMTRASMVEVPREFSAFVLVGVVATAVSASLYNLLAHTAAFGGSGLVQQPFVAFALSNMAGMVVSFAGTRWWVFRARPVTGAAGGLVGFVAVNVLSWAVPLASLAFSRYVLDLSSALADNIAVNVVGLAAGTVVRFLALRITVFFPRP